ncbi:hypothetical protein LTR53_014390 [Teratosphaeriaceae sp. CCFEE 6253]|nr:hypothetical protein LTR53_014390 [Teratosphaeriaceae sp. CCFEE 6253]
MSQTASDYISSQIALEEDAREALPYQFDSCSKPLGALRQSTFACLTCTPPPASRHQQFTPAGICYSCSISCHGEHTLVELFAKRNFACDCGTTRFATSGTPCSLRSDAVGRKGGVVGEKAAEGNRYNQNYQGKFCGCGEVYDPEKEKGTMFQCLGLGTVDETVPRANGVEKLATVREDAEEVPGEAVRDEDEEPLPIGFPAEDDFDHVICHKCVEAFPWIKQYAGTPGFLIAVSAEGTVGTDSNAGMADHESTPAVTGSKKRSYEDDYPEMPDRKKVKADTDTPSIQSRMLSSPKPAQLHASHLVSEAPVLPTNEHSDLPRHAALPPAPTNLTSLFLRPDFRDHLCRCTTCFPRLQPHPYLLEEEEPAYEPPLSESSNADAASVGGRSVNSGSLLERGEAALSSMDRVQAIEGVMAYNHVKEKVREFLKPFAESGVPVGAEEIRAYFAKLRGDEAGIGQAGEGGAGGGAASGQPGGGGGSQGAY